ncbi:MAG: biotin biosynthesis protein BioC [Proteobacteria bacterium]|nr:biotin biosynthesis protein BioC [Pseudomonadota bacterium]
MLKQRVRAAFDRAAPTYDAAAIVQRRVCDRLLDALQIPDAPQRIIDAGCGTGYGARRLRSRWADAHITGVDFAPSMLELARQDFDACFTADIEKLPCEDALFDLWWSSLSLQWCDAGIAFGEAMRVLKTGGWLAVSTLGPATFHELRHAFAGVDHHRHTLSFSEADAIGDALGRAGFRNIVLRRERHIVHYPDLKSLLRAVKAIGAHNVGEGGRAGMLGRHAWQNVEAAYEHFRQADGLPASYDVIFACAQK